MMGQHSKFVELDESINGHIKNSDGSMVHIKGKDSIMSSAKMANNGFFMRYIMYPGCAIMLKQATRIS